MALMTTIKKHNTNPTVYIIDTVFALFRRRCYSYSSSSSSSPSSSLSRDHHHHHYHHHHHHRRHHYPHHVIIILIIIIVEIVVIIITWSSSSSLSSRDHYHHLHHRRRHHHHHHSRSGHHPLLWLTSLQQYFKFHIIVEFMSYVYTRPTVGMLSSKLPSPPLHALLIFVTFATRFLQRRMFRVARSLWMNCAIEKNKLNK